MFIKMPPWWWVSSGYWCMLFEWYEYFPLPWKAECLCQHMLPYVALFKILYLPIPQDTSGHYLRNHPEIIQKSSRNHPEIIQKYWTTWPIRPQIKIPFWSESESAFEPRTFMPELEKMCEELEESDSQPDPVWHEIGELLFQRRPFGALLGHVRIQ